MKLILKLDFKNRQNWWSAVRKCLDVHPSWMRPFDWTDVHRVLVMQYTLWRHNIGIYVYISLLVQRATPAFVSPAALPLRFICKYYYCMQSPNYLTIFFTYPHLQFNSKTAYTLRRLKTECYVKMFTCTWVMCLYIM